jgi:hypothetical protein
VSDEKDFGGDNASCGKEAPADLFPPPPLPVRRNTSGEVFHRIKPLNGSMTYRCQNMSGPPLGGAAARVRRDKNIYRPTDKENVRFLVWRNGLNSSQSDLRLRYCRLTMQAAFMANCAPYHKSEVFFFSLFL